MHYLKVKYIHTNNSLCRRISAYNFTLGPVSLVLHPWIQPTLDHVVMLYVVIEKKNLLVSWSTVQACVIHRSTLNVNFSVKRAMFCSILIVFKKCTLNTENLCVTFRTRKMFRCIPIPLYCHRQEKMSILTHGRIWTGQLFSRSR